MKPNHLTVPVSVIAVVVVIVFGVLRMTLPPPGIDMGDFFKDMAHIVVGGLFGMSLAFWLDGKNHPSKFYGVLAVGLTVLEVVAFFIR